MGYKVQLAKPTIHRVKGIDDAKYQGIIDSGADKLCTPYKDIKRIIIPIRMAKYLLLRQAINLIDDISPYLTEVLVSKDLDTTLLLARKISQKGICSWIPPAGCSYKR